MNKRRTMLPLCIFILVSIFGHETDAARLGVIHGASFTAPNAMILRNKTDCHSCICELFNDTWNLPLGAFNCLANGTVGSAVNCQFFLRNTPMNSTSNGLRIDSSSTFFFRPGFQLKAAKPVTIGNIGILVAGNGTQGSALRQLNQPSCLYIDSDDNLYICDTSNHRIQKWSNNGTSVVTVAGGSEGNSANQLNRPLALTFDSDGFMYVADAGNCRIQRFAPNSTWGVTVAGDPSGNCGGGLDRLDEPTGIAVDRNFNLFIADHSNRRIVQYLPNATIGISLFGRMDGKPYSITLKNRSSDQLYITDTQRKKWQIWTIGASTADLTVDCSNYVDSPSSILVDNDANVYVVDETNERVWMFPGLSSTGELLLGNITNLQSSTAMALDSQMNLYLTSRIPAGVYKYPRVSFF